LLGPALEVALGAVESVGADELLGAAESVEVLAGSVVLEVSIDATVGNVESADVDDDGSPAVVDGSTLKFEASPVAAGSVATLESLGVGSTFAAAGAPGRMPGRPPFIANAPPPTNPPKITNPEVATRGACIREGLLVDFSYS
jgi:hypothetical protein